MSDDHVGAEDPRAGAESGPAARLSSDGPGGGASAGVRSRRRTDGAGVEGAGVEGAGRSGNFGAGRSGNFMFRVQRFVIGRTWSLLLLVVVSELGSMVMFRMWELGRPTGRAVAQTGLLALGLAAYWAWPTRARFMRRLCLLLVLGGLAMLGVTWGLARMNGEAARLGDLASVMTYWGGEVARNWLVSGALLGVLMWGGRRVFTSMRESPADKARRSSNARSGEPRP